MVRQTRERISQKADKTPLSSDTTTELETLFRSLKGQRKKISDVQIQQRTFGYIKNLICQNDIEKLKNQLGPAIKTIKRHMGIQQALNVVKRIEVSAGMRRPSLALYDNCLHFIGGGQKYGMTLVKALLEKFDITILANKPVSHRHILEWYGLDLHDCQIKIIPLPFYEKRGTIHLDPVFITPKMANPFHRISRESAHYDFFINNSMLEMVYPLSNISIMMVHFPERRPGPYFYSHAYTQIMYNSQYTASWIEKKWKIKPHRHIYPPVDMEIYDGKSHKKNTIISVARFEEGGTKKQLEMIKCFARLKERHPQTAAGWRFILVGGSNPQNPYLKTVENLVQNIGKGQVEIKVNISAGELKALYRDSSIFWHLCGLGQNDPAKIEHFGMTICEAMQNNMVPLVFDGGGQKEIVDHNLTGFRVNSTFQLIHHTVQLMEKKDKLQAMGQAAREKSKNFSKERFMGEVQEFFSQLLDSYLGNQE